MASIRKDIVIEAASDRVWDAIRDYGAVHERLVPGFVVDARLDAGDRIVTFFSGAVQREPLVDLDDQTRRLVYTAVDSPLGATHYNASVQVFALGEARSRVEWIVDFLPNELRARLDQAMDTAAASMKRTLDAPTTREEPSRSRRSRT